MIALIYENFLILKKQIAMASILLLMSIVPSIMYSDYIFLVFSTILISMLPITACVYENESKMIKVLLSMPISRATFVGSKYISTLILSGIGFVLNFFFYFTRQQNFLISFVLSLVCFLIGTTLMNIMLPLVFKYGVERAKFLLVCIMIVLGAIGSFVYKTGLLKLINIEISLVIIFGIGCYFVIYFISYVLSTKLYSRIDII